jgi:hypothetical protein
LGGDEIEEQPAKNTIADRRTIRTADLISGPVVSDFISISLWNGFLDYLGI